MTNLIWYILLSSIGIGLIICTIYKKRNNYRVSTLIIFYFTSASFAWIGEFIVLGLFNAYTYKTGLFANMWADNLFAHLILNTTIYPAIAILSAVYSLRFSRIALIAVIFVFIEYVFIKLNAYEQHWWRYYMTATSVVIYLLLTRYWFSKIKQKPQGFIRALTYYFVAVVVLHIPAPILLLLGKQHYQIDWITKLFNDIYLTSIIFIFSYHLIESFILVLFVCIFKKGYLKAVPFFISFIVQYVLYQNNILIFKDGWNFIYTLLVYDIFIAAFILLEKYSLIPEPINFEQCEVKE